jgi:hypothetical protein
MASAYARRVADQLDRDERRVLTATPPAGQSATARIVAGQGDGQVRYRLRRRGLIRMTHPDGKGRAWVYRTTFGDEVVALLAVKA